MNVFRSDLRHVNGYLRLFAHVLTPVSPDGYTQLVLHDSSGLVYELGVSDEQSVNDMDTWLALSGFRLNYKNT